MNFEGGNEGKRMNKREGEGREEEEEEEEEGKKKKKKKKKTFEYGREE